MTVPRQYAFSIGTSAVELTGTEFPAWIMRNNSAVIIYLGDSAVTTANGFPIDAGAFFSPGEIGHKALSEKQYNTRIYAIAGSTSNDVRVFLPGRV